MKNRGLLKIAWVASMGILMIPGANAWASESKEGEQILSALIRANDNHIRDMLERTSARQRGGSRGIGSEWMVFAAAYCSRGSRFYHDERLVAAMGQYAGMLSQYQLRDGLWDIGNLDSPPDSSFVLKMFCKGQILLEQDGSEKTAALRAKAKEIILKCAEGVRRGGVHTPNHRWAICSALAHVHKLYPDKGYVDRIDDWLGEGIDVDEDGQWAERSPNYTADVNNPAMVDLAILLDRPALLEGVRRNLEMTIFHVEPNGEVETVASRRQDQRAGSREFIWEYYYPYRYLAIRDNNPRFAAMARYIERDFLNQIGMNSTNMSSALTCMLEFPELTKALPEDSPLPYSYTKIFTKTAMARIRRGTTSATIYGGSDWFAGLGVGSGLATNPTFFKLRKGEAILDSIRMTPAFFSTGFFYSRGLQAGEGNTYRLSQTLNVPYHLPLPAEYRDDKGAYKLSPDMGTEGLLGRYFSKLDFDHRPKQFITLKSQVVVTETNGVFELHFLVDGYLNVPVTIELAFRAGGTFTGVQPAAVAGGIAAAGDAGIERGGREGRTAAATNTGAAVDFILREGHGSYTVGNDAIEFGPGSFVRMPGRMEGESPYSSVSGSLRAEGVRVYITGITPFSHRLILK